jgi:hypothetical protein
VQGPDRLVLALLADGVVEVGRRIERIELLGDCELIGVERTALLLEVGFAQVGAQQGIAGVQARRDLEVPSTSLQGAVADHRETEAEPGQGIGGVAGNRLSEG